MFITKNINYLVSGLDNVYDDMLPMLPDEHS